MFCHPLPTESLEDLISGSAATADAVAALSLKPALKEDIAPPSGMPKKQSKQATSQVLQGSTTNASTLASTLSVKVREIMGSSCAPGRSIMLLGIVHDITGSGSRSEYRCSRIYT